MGPLFKKYKWLKIVLGVLMLTIGVVTAILAFNKESQGISKVIIIMLAVCLFILGAVALMSSLLTDSKKFFTSTMLYAALLIAFGVVILVIDDNAITTMIATFLIVICFSFAGVWISKAISFIIYKEKTLNIVLEFVAAGLALTFAICGIIWKSTIVDITYIIIGICVGLAGILEIVLGVMSIFNDKKNKIVVENQ